jgi:hypothetical protein
MVMSQRNLDALALICRHVEALQGAAARAPWAGDVRGLSADLVDSLGPEPALGSVAQTAAALVAGLCEDLGEDPVEHMEHVVRAARGRRS